MKKYVNINYKIVDDDKLTATDVLASIGIGLAASIIGTSIIILLSYLYAIL